MHDKTYANTNEKNINENTLKIVFNIPNILTMLRIILAPFFMIFLLNDKYLVAFIILLIASITDFLDGMLARKLNMQTQFGRILDPIADKVLILVSMLALLIKFHFPLWIGLIIILRDFLIVCGGALIIYKKKQQYLAPSILGKTSTVFQLLSMLIYIVASLNGYYALWIDILLYLTVIITVLSGLNYVLTGYLILKLPDSTEEIVKEVFTSAKTTVNTTAKTKVKTKNASLKTTKVKKNIKIKANKDTKTKKNKRTEKNRNEKKHKKK